MVLYCPVFPGRAVYLNQAAFAISAGPGRETALDIEFRDDRGMIRGLFEPARTGIDVTSATSGGEGGVGQN